jgi:hypothetical protein
VPQIGMDVIAVGTARRRSYSYRKAKMGLARAIRTACAKMVAQTIDSATPPAAAPR